MDNQTQILDRIRKLLAKANDSSVTEAEANAFMEKASRLLAEHNLDMASLKRSEDDEQWGQGKMIQRGKWTREIALASQIINEHFFVKTIMMPHGNKGVGRGFTLYAYGMKTNVVSAKYVFDGLLAAFENLWQSYRRKTKCEAKFRKTFICGVANGFSDKMKMEKYHMAQERDQQNHTPGGTAIQLRSVQEKTLEMFQRVYPSTKKVSGNFSHVHHDNEIRSAGYSAGQKLNINRPIGGKSSGQRKIEG